MKSLASTPTAAPSKLRFAAALVRTDYGRALELMPGRFSMVLRQARGVAGVVVPWNSPVVLLFRSLARASAAGCTAVVKMPGQTAQLNSLVFKLFSEVYDEFEEGGFKQSGLGRMNGLAVIDDFVEYKHITINAGVVAR